VAEVETETKWKLLMYLRSRSSDEECGYALTMQKTMSWTRSSVAS
jgi:hypothetical protein